MKTCQAGIGESVEKIKGSDGSLKVQKGKGRQAWKELVVAYEAKVGWLKTPEGREVGFSFVFDEVLELVR